MNEYRYTPRPKNRNAQILCILLVALGVLAFILAGYFPNYVGSVRMAALILVVVGLFLGIKFIFSTNTYILMRTDKGACYFLVEQAQGKRSSLVCQLPLRRITEVREMRRGRDKTPKGRLFSYVATLGLQEYQLLTAEGDDGKPVQVKLEADEAFFSELKRWLSDCRTAAPIVREEEETEV